MIVHVVLMKFKPENQSENMSEACARLRGMLGRVPTLRELEVGPHVEESSARSLDLALVTRFDDLAGLRAYAEHPVHLQVKDFLGQVLESSYIVDFAS